MSYIVQIEDSVYLDGSDGDPGRCILRKNARVHDTREEAEKAMSAAVMESYRELPNIKVVEVRDSRLK